MKQTISTFWIMIALVLSLKAQPPSDTLIIGYSTAAPFIITEDAELQGLSIWLWKKIAHDLEIQYELREMPFGEMLHSIETGDIDLSINPLTVTSERSERMDFSHPFFATNATAAQLKVGGIHKLWHIIGTIFSLNFFRVVLGLVVLIATFGTIVWYFERKKNKEQFRPWPTGIWDGLWWSAVTMTTVGYGDKSPKSRVGKVIALVWMFSGIIFISGFTASIASSLTVSDLHVNASEVHDYKNKPIGCVKSTSTVTFLKDQFFKKVTEYDNLTDGLQALKNEEINAFLYDEPILKYRLKNSEEFRRIDLMPIKFNMQFYAFTFAHDHDILREKVSKKIMQYTESMEWKMLLAEYDLHQH